MSNIEPGLSGPSYEAEKFGAPEPVKATASVGSNTRPSQVVYNRAQKGHSVILHALFGVFALWIPTVYFICSPRHYFHA